MTMEDFVSKVENTNEMEKELEMIDLEEIDAELDELEQVDAELDQMESETQTSQDSDNRVDGLEQVENPQYYNIGVAKHVDSKRAGPHPPQMIRLYREQSTENEKYQE